MLVYSTERFIKAHMAPDTYHNHSYDRMTRDAICGNCGYIIGEQVRYTHLRSKEFYFDDHHKNDWKCCPKCCTRFYDDIDIDTDKTVFLKKEEPNNEKQSD